MKKVYIIATLALSCFAISCSNEDLDGINGGEGVSVEDKYVPGDSEVAISLGTIAKRAAIDGENGDLDEMGVFCLAKAKNQINQSAYDIDWFGNGHKWSSCVLANVSAKKEGAKVSWTDEVTYYYPLSQFYAYDFFAYYPYVNDSNRLDTINNKVKVRYEIDGKQDIIWGKASSDERYAYCAKYFRIPENENKKPMLQMYHMLTRLIFKVRPGAKVEGGLEVGEAANMEIVSIKIIDVLKHIEMTVADFENPVSIGGTTASELSQQLLTNYTAETDTFTLCDANGVEISQNPVAVGSDINIATQVGESIMLYPDSQYLVQIETRYKNGDSYINLPPTEEPLIIYNNGGKFEAGLKYTVDITVHGPKEIEVEANLNPWEDALESENPKLDL